MAQCGDLHELATLNIAKAAGYSDEDAVLLAWANGMTDRCDGMGFHTQVNALTCLWSKAGLYFHFWPSDKKDLICRVDSELSERITKPLRLAPRYSSPVGLCYCGIALHGLQDSYFHSNWTGKFSRHNVLPAWANGKFTPSLPFPYGHSPMGKIPDVATATWYDPRTSEIIKNGDRVKAALEATARTLGLAELPLAVEMIFSLQHDYEERKKSLRELAHMPKLRLSEIRKEMLKKYRVELMQAAKAQARIVEDYLK